MSRSLSGPSAEPASGRPARQVVVLLHGVGADGADLMAMVPHVAEALPDAAFLAPDAPFAYDMAPSGRQWFSLGDRSAAALSEGVRAVAPMVDSFIDAHLAARGLDDNALALVGFSQGTMVALHVAFRRLRPCAAVVGFSGALLAPERLPGEIRSRPATLLIHGSADAVVNPACLPQAEAGLAAVGVPVLARTLPGVGHAIDGSGLAAAVAFVRQSFAAARP
ncbi:MAG: dienelactone hydrolase family protein [Magnetospirillum sp.]|nr:dienelactone hydrolase family protein [Magnetospirillum sp.]